MKIENWKLKIFLEDKGLFGLGDVEEFAVAHYFFTHQGPQTPKDPEQAKLQEIEKKRQDEIKEVGKQIDLPKDEEPITATVTDRNALAGQEFFEEARNGDRVLMYPKAKKAYLYRPSENRVVAIAPLDYQDPNEIEASKSATASPSATITQ